MTGKQVRLNLVLFLMFAVFGAMSSAAADEAGDQSSKIRAFILRGEDFYNKKDYASAIKTWSKVLDLDPLNEEVGDRIDDAKFQADYQVAVLDRLSAASRVRTSKSAELDRLAKEMTQMLARAKSEKGEVLERQISSVAEEEAEEYASKLLAAQERFAAVPVSQPALQSVLPPQSSPTAAALPLTPARPLVLPVKEAFNGQDSVRIGMRVEVSAPVPVKARQDQTKERLMTGVLLLTLIALCVAAGSMFSRRKKEFMFVPPRGPLKGGAKTFDPRTLRKHLGRREDGPRKERGLMD